MAKARTITEIVELAKTDAGALTAGELRLLRSMNRRQGKPDGERQLAYSRRKMSEAADIGDIPAVVNPERRESCRLNLRLFLETYFPHSTGLSPFSEDHIRQIGHMQACVLDGGWFMEAVYRGFAKTTISENTAIWAALYGHRQYIPVFGVSKEASIGNIESIKMEFAENPILMEDFPEACYPISRLENKPQRCKGQTQHGFPTHIVWRADTIVLPTVRVDGQIAVAAGTVIRAKPYAKSRGMVYKRPDGTQARPDFVIIDDPQDDESAVSPAQVAKNLNILRKAILPSAGHRRRLACVVNATVIAADDMIERLLADPAWQGERIPMIRHWAAAHETLWRDYADLRRRFDRSVPGDKDRAAASATALYDLRRADMDAGCVVSWASCYSPDDGELSAIQHAYNMLIDLGEEVFASECQNRPLSPDIEESFAVTVERVRSKAIRLARGVVPLSAQHLVGFMDVHDRLLYWAVAAWGDGFGGHVVEYGCWPPQKHARFTLKSCPLPMSRRYPKAGKEGAIAAGLNDLADALLAREFRREDGMAMRIALCLVDSGHETEGVERFCRRSAHASALVASKGLGIGAGAKPMSDYTRQAGDRWGLNWYLTANKVRTQAVARYDTNYWKTFLHARLMTAAGDPGSLTLFDGRHDLLAEHIVAERPVRTQGRGRELNEWKQLAGQDNHWLDCLVGCCVAGSMRGVALADAKPMRRKAAVRKRPAVKYF